MKICNFSKKKISRKLWLYDAEVASNFEVETKKSTTIDNIYTKDSEELLKSRLFNSFKELINEGYTLPVKLIDKMIKAFVKRVIECSPLDSFSDRYEVIARNKSGNFVKFQLKYKKGVICASVKYIEFRNNFELEEWE